MKIAQVAPLFESVPPSLYGGTERIVSYLTEELVLEGHDVTLFASGDSTTAARLIPVTPRSLRLDESCIDQLAHHMVLLDAVFSRRHEFDIIHFHIDYMHFPVSRWLDPARVTTLHGRLDLPDLQPLYSHFIPEPLVSISDSQRAPLPFANWQQTVYHGLPTDLLPFSAEPGSYFAFLGRISPEKRVDRAVAIARAVGVPLKVAAKIDKSDQAYFDSEIRHLFEDPIVEYLGEVGEADKAVLLGGACALLFPIDWEEPFGLVMAEALACGTPVIASPRGSVPEVLEDGVTGYLVDSLEEAVSAAQRIDQLSRRACRDTFERRFSAARMAQNYLGVYERILSRRRSVSELDTRPRLAPSAQSLDRLPA
jgi:glycosyltransferase involved in cell wall biosynthesis